MWEQRGYAFDWFFPLISLPGSLDFLLVPPLGSSLRRAGQGGEFLSRKRDRGSGR